MYRQNQYGMEKGNCEIQKIMEIVVTKLCLLRVSDTEPLLSILPMLEGAGYECVLPDRRLRDEIRTLGGRNVDEFEDMQRRWGAEMPPARLKEVGREVMDRLDLYVDVNGNHNGPKLWGTFPRLLGKVLTYFINGGEPRNVPDKGDCQMPTTPMATTAQHYRSTLFCPNKHWNVEAFSCDDPPNPRGYWTNRELSKVPKYFTVETPLNEKTPNICRGADGQMVEETVAHLALPHCSECYCILKHDEGDYGCPHGCGPLIRAPWLGKVYVFYPSFNRWESVLPRYEGPDYGPPISMVHNCLSWGCQGFVEPARALGVKAYGGGNSPDGKIDHKDIWPILQRALCTVYLKGGGAVDYSILEPMAAGCPTTFHDSYVHNCRLYDLLEPGVTCLTWGSEKEMAEVIERMCDPAENRRIGEAGRRRMMEVCWTPEKGQASFNEFMGRTFP